MSEQNGDTGPQHITREEFDSNVLIGKGAVIVDIWAEWCAPCRMLAPFVHKLAAELEGTVRVVKLDYDPNRDLKSKFGFDGIPALLCFNDGEIVDMVVGFGGYAGLRQPIDAFVEKVTGQPTSTPSSLEQQFVEAEKAAELAHDTIEAKARAEFYRAFRPVDRNTKRTVARAQKALANGKIDEAEKTRRVARAQAKLEAASDSARAAYGKTMNPVMAAYIQAMEVAAGIFVESHSTASEAAFCAIGDSSCHV
jgi:thioredoxin 1